jgi:predicted nuclease of predicted toxin-antitoxin system
MGHLPDADIAKLAREQDAVLVTRDLDFADIRAYPPEQHSGLLVIRLYDDATAIEINRLLEKFLKVEEWAAALPQRLAIVEEARVRFRPALVR